MAFGLDFVHLRPFLHAIHGKNQKFREKFREIQDPETLSRKPTFFWAGNEPNSQPTPGNCSRINKKKTSNRGLNICYRHNYHHLCYRVNMDSFKDVYANDSTITITKLQPDSISFVIKKTDMSMANAIRRSLM